METFVDTNSVMLFVIVIYFITWNEGLIKKIGKKEREEDYRWVNCEQLIKYLMNKFFIFKTT